MRNPRSIAAFFSSGGIAVALAAFGAVAAGACSSFGADDGGSGAGDANATADAAAAADAPGTADGSDAGAANDGGPFTNAFCAAHLNDQGFFYCNDFEMPTQAMTPFGFAEAVVTPSTSDLVVTNDAERTAVLKATVKAPSPAAHDVSVRQSLGISPGAGGPLPVQIDLDIKIVTNDTPSATLAALHVAGFDCEGEYGLGAFDGTSLGGTRNRDVTLRPYSNGVWAHLTISVQKDGTSSTGFRELTTYAGVPLVDRPARASSGAAPAACNNNDLLLGITETGSNAANVIVMFDNVLVRKL